jgi:hypothetical protein
MSGKLNWQVQEIGEQRKQMERAKYDANRCLLAGDISEKYQSQNHRPLKHSEPAQSV